MWDLFRRTSPFWDHGLPQATFTPAIGQDRFPASLASSVEGADFTADITVQWRGGDNRQVETVRAAVRRYLARQAGNYRVSAADELADLVNSRGTASRPIENTDLVLTLLHVRLTASAQAHEITAAWEEARREEARETARQQQELQRLRFLRDEVFGQPDIARMYWHLKHPTELSSLTSPAFEEVAARLKQGAPATTTPARDQTVSRLVGEFVDGLADDERAHLIKQLGLVFRNFRRTDLAEQLPPPETGPPPRPES